jgi:hypothetical protein
MTSAPVHAEGAGGVHLLLSRSRVPLPSMDGGSANRRGGGVGDPSTGAVAPARHLKSTNRIGDA